MKRQRRYTGPAFGSHESINSALWPGILFRCRDSTWVIAFAIILPEGLYRYSETTGTHCLYDSIGMRIAGRREDAYACVTAIFNALAGPRALLTVVEINDANTTLEFFQHPANFAWRDVPVHVVHYMGTGYLGDDNL